MGKRSLLGGVIVVVAAAMSFVVVGPAGASEPDRQQTREAGGGCNNGDVCVWRNNVYASCWRDMNTNQSDWAVVNFAANSGCSGNNIKGDINSLKNRRSCGVRFWKQPNQGGISLYFNAYPNGTYQDPNLSNGGGIPSGDSDKNFANAIESHACVA